MAAKKPASTAVANYDEELARLAGAGASLTQTTGGGKFFSTRAGVLQFDDAPLPGNQVCAVIASWCLENVFYDGAYDPDNRTPPTCFAFCKDPSAVDEMGPPDIVDKEDAFERQSDLCETCPQNEWGSAKTGRGKACSNRRRLAILPAGAYKPLGRTGGHELELVEANGIDVAIEHFTNADAGFLKIPVMSGKGFDAYVKDIAGGLPDGKFRPLFAVYTRIYLTPDPKSQFKVNFELIEPVSEELIPTLLARYKKLHDEIDFPYTPFTEDEAAPTQTRSAAADKKLTKPKARR